MECQCIKGLPSCKGEDTDGGLEGLAARYVCQETLAKEQEVVPGFLLIC